MDPATIALTLASGAIVGTLLASFGGGGSILAAPLLLYLVGVTDAHVAIGTSSLAVAANAGIGLAGHARAGRVKWPCALVFAGAGLAGSLGGSTIAKHLPGDDLLLAFSIAMAAIALSMFRKPQSDGDGDAHLDVPMAARLVPIGLLTGFAAGFFGIGGGFLIVPGLILATHMTMANASASSLVSVVAFGSATSFNYALSGYVDFTLAALLVGGGVIGGLIGLYAAKALATRALLARRLFAVMVLLVAVYVASRALQLF